MMVMNIQNFVLRNLPPRLLTGNESLYAHFYFGRSSAVMQASLAVEASKVEPSAASTDAQKQNMDNDEDDEFEDLDSGSDDWPEGEEYEDEVSVGWARKKERREEMKRTDD